MRSIPIVILGITPFAIFMLGNNYSNDALYPFLPVESLEKSVDVPSPFLSIKPLEKSLHPKWKLFTEMSESKKDEALDIVGAYLTKYGKVIGTSTNKKQGGCVYDTDIGSTG